MDRSKKASTVKENSTDGHPDQTFKQNPKKEPPNQTLKPSLKDQPLDWDSHS